MKKYKVINCFLFSILLLLTSCSKSSVDRGEEAIELGDYSMAMGFFSEALHKDPRNYRARLGMGKSLIQKAAENSNDTSSWRQALVHLEAARTLKPEQDNEKYISEAWLVYGDNLLELGDTLKSLKALARSIEYDSKRSETYNLIAILYAGIGYEDKAELLFKKSIEIDKGQAAAFFNLGMINWNKGKFKVAYNLWYKALENSPEDDDILYWFAIASSKVGVKK